VFDTVRPLEPGVDETVGVDAEGSGADGGARPGLEPFGAGRRDDAAGQQDHERESGDERRRPSPLRSGHPCRVPATGHLRAHRWAPGPSAGRITIAGRLSDEMVM
jgi:hypothetical protein